MISPLAGLETPSRASLPGRRSATVAAIGDALLSPPIVSGAASLAHRPDSSLAWLGMLRPDLGLLGDLVLGRAGTVTTDLPSRLTAILAAARRPDMLLISAGHEDCLATMRGIAPSVEESIAALEATSRMASAAGLRPIFVVPPPSRHFANGLFAERYVTIAATLRRLALRDAGTGVVDAVQDMTRPRAVGIEPASDLVSDAQPGRLTPAGALRLAAAMADALGEPGERPADGTVVNPNALLRNVGGSIATASVAGRCAEGYRLDAEGLPPGRCEAMVLAPGGQRLRLTQPEGASLAGFLRLSQVVPAETVAGLGPGDTLTGEAQVAVSGSVGRVASLCVTVTPVWDGGFFGLHSHEQSGAWTITSPFRIALHTPAFLVPAPLQRLHLSLALRLDPAWRQGGETLIDIRSLSLRRRAATTRDDQ